MTILGPDLEPWAPPPAPGPRRGEWVSSRRGPPAVRRGGVALCSAFDPVLEAERAVPDWGPEVDFAVLPGLGAGYLAEAVARRYPDLPLIIAEPDPGWTAEVFEVRGLEDLRALSSVVLIVGADASAVGRFLEGLDCRTVEVLNWRPLAASDPGWFQLVAEAVSAAQARARVNTATYGRFGGLWQRNLLRNEASARAVRPLKALEGLRAGAPAVVAAAGPSLADALDWMVRLRDRYVLIAVDTAWPALAARGVEPDFLVVLDGQYWNARHVDRDPPDRTVVVTEWCGPPRAFRLAPGRTYAAATSIPFLRRREEGLWGTLGSLPSGGSVATAAWSLALLLGCTEVAFAGLDLGYPRGLTHVPGSQFEEAVHRTSRRLAPAETLGLGLRGLSGLSWRPALDGGLVRSDRRMDLFRDWLTAAVALHPEVRAVNLGTRGSLVPGLGRPEADYGHTWASLDFRPPSGGPVLEPRSGRIPEPPFALLAAVGDPDFGASLDRAWAGARDYWGTEVWDRWAGRARATWDRFPSARSRRALEDLVRLTLTWRRFFQKM